MDKTTYLVLDRGLTNSDYYKCNIIKETQNLQEAYEFAITNGYKTDNEYFNKVSIAMIVKPYAELFIDSAPKKPNKEGKNE